MLYKGRQVEYIRDAAKNDPYYDPEYNQVIVMYVDTLDRETVKEDQLDGWDAKERKGHLTDLEKKRAIVQDKAKKDAKDNHPFSEETKEVEATKTPTFGAKPAVVTPVKK
jgi:hypothetical protein